MNMFICHSHAKGTVYTSNVKDKMNEYEKSVFDYVVSAYSFIIVGMGKMNFSQFADEIEKYCSLENPVNAEVCRILRKI